MVRHRRGFAGTVERERHLSTLSVRTPGKKQEVSQLLLEALCGTEKEANPNPGPTRDGGADAL